MPEPDTPTASLTISIHDAARKLAVNEAVVRTLVAEGRIETMVKPGTARPRLLRRSVEAYWRKLYGES